MVVRASRSPSPEPTSPRPPWCGGTAPTGIRPMSGAASSKPVWPLPISRVRDLPRSVCPLPGRAGALLTLWPLPLPRPRRRLFCRASARPRPLPEAPPLLSLPLAPISRAVRSSKSMALAVRRRSSRRRSSRPPYRPAMLPPRELRASPCSRRLTVAPVNPTPSISSLSPASVTAGSAAFTLTVTGTGFAAGATATVGGQARTVTVDSATQVRIALQATDVASQGTPTVVVTNPTSCTNAMCVSNGVYLTVAAPSTSNTSTTTGGTTSTTTGGTTSTTTGATDPSTPPSSTSGTSGTTSSPSGASVVASPVLYFTDLASGPRSGNKDTSRGQIANQDGALVTVWGQNLGTSQGTSTITLGGVAPAAIYYWGNATAPNCGAATLFNAYQKLQCIIFQVNHATAPGAQNIVVTVGGVATNALSFTVRTSGSIFFVAPTGGKFTSIQTALDTAALGDIIYVKNGSDVLTGVTPPYSTVPTGAPLALVVYPGHSVQVGDATHRAFDLTHSQSGKQMVYAKFTAWGPDVVVMVEQDGRFVGNLVQAPNGVGSTGAVTSDSYQAAPNRTVFGNEITNVGTTNPAAWDTLYHTIYFGGLRDGGSLVTGVEIGWNYIHDNKAFRAINLFSQLTSADSVLGGVNIHDNVIVNQQGQAVLFGRGLVGTLRVYNNLFINTGQDYSLDSSSVVAAAAYTAIDVRAGYLSGWAG